MAKSIRLQIRWERIPDKGNPCGSERGIGMSAKFGKYRIYVKTHPMLYSWDMFGQDRIFVAMLRWENCK